MARSSKINYPFLCGLKLVISNYILLYSTGNYIQYPVINHNGKAHEKEYIEYTYIYACKEPSHCYTADINTAL